MQLIQALSILAFTAFVHGLAVADIPDSVAAVAQPNVPAIRGRAPTPIAPVVDVADPNVDEADVAIPTPDEETPEIEYIDLDDPANEEIYKRLLARGKNNCSNAGVSIKTAMGACDPADSKGTLSSHNCFTKGGTAYYCQQGKGPGQCISGKSKLKKLGLEGGECFL